MFTTQEDIRRWLERGKDQAATHLMVVVDGFNHEDYPVFVFSHENVRDSEELYNGKNMQRVMEIYNIGMDWESQLSEYRAHNY